MLGLWASATGDETLKGIHRMELRVGEVVLRIEVEFSVRGQLKLIRSIS